MILLSKEELQNQLPSLLEKYPNLKVIKQTENQVDIAGRIQINRASEVISVYQEYGIEISIPINSDKLPTVRDTERYIKKYTHLSSDKNFCLATDTDMYLRFRNGFDLSSWMEDYVELYFVSYEYYKRYGAFPFGERAHGSNGILEFYRDYFKLSTLYQASDIIVYIANKRYKGHHLCPCGSNKKLRDCHKDEILSSIQDDFFLNLIRKDLEYIERERKSAKNNRTPKRNTNA